MLPASSGHVESNKRVEEYKRADFGTRRTDGCGSAEAYDRSNSTHERKWAGAQTDSQASSQSGNGVFP